jgi:hypothetical protein
LIGYTWFRQAPLEESLEVVHRRLRLVLANTCGGRDAPHVEAICFLVIIVVIVGRGCNPPRVPLSPILASPGVLLGVLDGDVG